MKAIIITQPGGPEVLQLAERPVPGLKPGEVLVKVAAAGVNRPDVAQRKGNYPPPPGASTEIPGLEIAGAVVELGADVNRWKTGDQICALVTGAGYSGYCAVPAGQCLPVPANLTLTEAASLPETFFTVWSNVFDRAKLQPGESLLVHGGSGGIGVAAIQMAKAMGCTVYVSAGSTEKCAFCEGLGADEAINYKTQNFKDEICRITNNKGVDVILDMIGGDYTPDNLLCLADEGRLVQINSMKGREVKIDLALIMRKRISITGSMLRSRDVAFKSAIAQNLEKHIWPFLASGQIKPIIYKTFPAAQAAEAHRLMESSDHMGKIILTF
ncbi:zinc-binding dehydrogenase [Mucilaginibacter sp. PPCGB 2223]|uniref:NAD(P)H-quinone oxidoreductase n=1 Tax=Mucilaginibacter sp. PPCGB 2223 TaxID=1886027 RepID=UPI0008259E87|nr:NAD(P)H-quinone oxidoreductase [Mucilaginibacter sp. PPCGB 2223]OCX51597.1 zinc-binding dehydrogenase [Mucilaginibacter sp. PPCGB 2223]